MWRDYSIYPLALALFIGVILAFNGVHLLLLEYSPALAKQWAASTPGAFLGGFALVLGFLKDNRFREQSERLAQTAAERDQATAQIVKLRRQNAEAQREILQAQHQVAMADLRTKHARERGEQQAEDARQRAEQDIARERQRAEQETARERQRADDLAVQLERARAENARIAELADRLRRLEAANGIAPTESDSDDDGDDDDDGDGDGDDAVP